DGPLEGGELPRTGGVGPHGGRVRGPPEPRNDPAPDGLQVPPAPEGLRPGGRPPVHHPAEAPRRDVSAGVLDQHGAAAPDDARPLEHESEGGRRDDHGREAGDRVPAPWIREDHGGAGVPEERRPHGPPVLRLFDHLVPRLLPRRREDDGDRDAGARPVDPRDRPRVATGRVAPDVARVVRSGPRPAHGPPLVPRERELFLDLIQLMSGARMNQNYPRVGGVRNDLRENFEAMCKRSIEHFLEKVKNEYPQIFQESKVFRMRTEGVGTISAADAINWGVTGPNLRACGVNVDLRRLD